MYLDKNHVDILITANAIFLFYIVWFSVSYHITRPRIKFPVQHAPFLISFRNTVAPSSRMLRCAVREKRRNAFSFTSRRVSGPLGGEFLQQRFVPGRYGRRVRHRRERRRRRGRQSSGCLAFPPRLIIARHPVAVAEPARGHQQSHRQTVHDAE